MCMTTVINIKDAPFDWKTNPRYVYIGRGGKGVAPSKWGNPFCLRYGYSRADSIAAYYHFISVRKDMLEQLSELRSRVLVCHCKPKACHGDVLVVLAENMYENKKLEE